VCPVSQLTLERLVSVATPTGKHQTHKYLFDLARGLRTLEVQEGGIKFPIDRVKEIFNVWHTSVPPEFLSHSHEDYFMEFLACLNSVKVPLSIRNALKDALDNARSNALPAAAELVTDPAKKLLIAVCYQLQKIAGDAPFFLSARDCQKFLQRPWRTCAYWLSGLVVLGVLKVEKKADFAAHKATRFRYIGT
jgi:hypothetical protein